MKSENPTGIMHLCDVVRQTGYELRQYLGHGHLEKVYENGLAHRLRKKGLSVQQQVAIAVHDEDGTLLGEYVSDILIGGVLIVELKACNAIADEHIAQILGYLRAIRIEQGLLINFGASKYEIKKFVLTVS